MTTRHNYLSRVSCEMRQFTQSLHRHPIYCSTRTHSRRNRTLTCSITCCFEYHTTQRNAPGKGHYVHSSKDVSLSKYPIDLLCRKAHQYLVNIYIKIRTHLLITHVSPYTALAHSNTLIGLVTHLLSNGCATSSANKQASSYASNCLHTRRTGSITYFMTTFRLGYQTNLVSSATVINAYCTTTCR